MLYFIDYNDDIKRISSIALMLGFDIRVEVGKIIVFDLKGSLIGAMNFDYPSDSYRLETGVGILFYRYNDYDHTIKFGLNRGDKTLSVIFKTTSKSRMKINISDLDPEVYDVEFIVDEYSFSAKMSNNSNEDIYRAISYRDYYNEFLNTIGSIETEKMFGRCGYTYFRSSEKVNDRKQSVALKTDILEDTITVLEINKDNCFPKKSAVEISEIVEYSNQLLAVPRNSGFIECVLDIMDSYFVGVKDYLIENYDVMSDVWGSMNTCLVSDRIANCYIDAIPEWDIQDRVRIY